MTEKNKQKNILRRLLATGFFVLFAIASFLFSQNANAVTGNYSKLPNGTLGSDEWNNLINDFLARSGGRMDGNFSINTATSSFAFDVNGTAQFSQPVIVGTPTLGTHAATRSYVDSAVTGGSGSTVGYWAMSGANINNSNAGNVGVGLTNPGSKLTIKGTGNASTTAALNVIGLDDTSHLFVRDDGYVGIGTTAPSAPLDVPGQVRIGKSGSGGGITLARAFDGSYQGYVGYTGATNDFIISNAGGGSTLQFRTGSNLERMRIDTNGNVGIGITNPVNLLSISSSTAAIIGTASTYAAYVNQLTPVAIGGDANYAYIQTFNSKPLSINPAGNDVIFNGAGNVGIGTTTPLTKFEVAGGGRFTNPVVVGTPTGGTHAATKSYVDSIVGGGIGTGTTGQTLRHDGTAWTPSSLLFNTGTNIGIGTTTPAFKLDVNGIVNATALYVNGVPYIGSQWITNGTSIYYNTGNVGIGTTAPGALLDVKKEGTGVESRIRIYAGTDGSASSANVARLTFRTVGAGGGVVDSNISQKLVGSNFDLYIEPYTNTIFNTGNVGIGTTSPTYKLEVNGTGLFNQPVVVGTPTINSHAATKSYVDSLVGGGSGSTVGYWTMNGTNISNSNSGNVGVGTTNPLSKLQVVGGTISSPDSGTNSERFGLNSQADGTYANAFGDNTDVSGSYSSGFGTDVTVTGNYSTAFGSQTTLHGDDSLVLGEASTVGATAHDVSRSIAMGTDNYIFNSNVVALGGSISTTHPNTFLVGTGVFSTAANQVVIGANGLPKTDVFFGNGVNNAAPSAYTIHGTSGSGTNIPGANILLAGGQGTGTGIGGSILFQTATAGLTGASTNPLSTRMTIDANGNVGINTTTPTYKLEVNGTGLFNQPVIVGTPTAATHATTKSYVDSLVGAGIGAGTSGQTLRHNGTSWVANSLLFNDGTNIGIGTTSPSSLLHLSSASTATLKINSISATGDDSDIRFIKSNNGPETWTLGRDNTNNDFKLSYVNNTTGGLGTGDLVTFKSSGNVGIGSTTPNYKLDVNGTGSFNQPVIVGTPTAATHATTKSYVDSLVGGGSGSTVGYWTMNGTNISNSNSGNVGVGITNPGYPLDVVGFINTTQASGYKQAGNTVLYSNPTYYITAVGASGAAGWMSTATSTLYNVAIGQGALATTPPGTIGTENMAIGAGALNSNTSGGGNVALGAWALNANNTGGANMAIGSNALTANTSGYENVAVGNAALLSNTTGGDNTAIGRNTLRSQSGSSNNNTAIGFQAGYDVTSGDNNIFLGYYPTTGVNITSGSDNILIGDDVRAGLNRTGSNQLNIGNLIFGTSVGTGATISSGNVGIASTTPNYKLDVNGTGAFNQPVIVGTPTANTHATTKSYVDSLVGAGIGAGTSGQTLRHNGTSWVANSLLFNNGTNIGIGTTAPNQLLEVAGATSTIKISDTTATRQPQLEFVRGAIDTFGSDGYTDWRIYGIGGDLRFLRQDNGGNSGDTVSFNANGNVGIGTTDPSLKLDVVGGIKISEGEGLNIYPNSSGQSLVNFYNSSGVNVDSYNSYMDGNFYFNHIRNTGRIDFRTTSSYISRLAIDGATGNVGIASTTPNYKLDVNGTGAFNQPVIVGTPTAATHAATKSYVDGLLSGAGGWTTNGNNIYNNNSGNVGIGTTNPGTLLTIANDQWISAVNGAGNGYANMFKINASNQIEVGSPLLIGPLEFAQDSGMITFVDMPVSATAANGSVEGYSMKIDGTNILTTFAQSNGAGGIQNPRVGIGITNPGYTLDVQGGAVNASGGFCINGDCKTAWSQIGGAYWNLSGNNLSASSTAWNLGIGTTTPNYKLDVNGTGAFNQPVIVGTPTANNHATTKSYVDGLIGSGIGAGTSGQTLRHNGTSWVANSTLFNDGTNVGIGTTTPGNTLEINPHGWSNLSSVAIGSGSDDATNPAITLYRPTGTGANVIPWQIKVGDQSVGVSTDLYFMTAPAANRGALAYSYPAMILSKISSGSYLQLNRLNGSYDNQLRFNDSSDTKFWMGMASWQDSGTAFGLYNDDQSQWAFRMTTTSPNVYLVPGSGNVGISSTTPNYKLDVNGASAFNQPVIVGTPTGNTHATTKSYVDGLIGNVSATTLSWEDNRTISPSELAANKMRFGFTSYNNNNTTPWADFLHFRSYQDSSGGSDNLLTINKSGLGLRLYQQTYGTTTAYTNYKDVLLADNSPILNYIPKYSVIGNNVSVANSLIFDNGTNVGIGKTNPATKLDVNGTVTATGFSGPLAGTINAINVSAGEFAASTGGGNFIFGATVPGYVGIGTNAPNHTLTISSNVGDGSAIGIYNTYNDVNSRNYTINTNWMAFGDFAIMQSNARYGNPISAGTNRFYISAAGNVGIATTTPTEAKLVINAGAGMALKAYGNGIFTGTMQTQTGSDFAEEFATTEDLEAGTVVVMDDRGYKSVKPSTKSHDNTVVGIVSNNPSIIAGHITSEHKAIVAMMGVVKVKVTSANGQIYKGDMLTTSNIKGYAMKADALKFGSIIGKALENLDTKTGEINVLVNLQ